MNPWRRLANFTHLDCWFWETDHQHRLVWIRESAAPAPGTEPLWWRARGDEDLDFPPFDEGQQLAHRRLPRNREPFRDFIARLSDPDGGGLLSFSGVPITNSGGEFQGYRGTVHNPAPSSAPRDPLDLAPGEMIATERRLWDELTETRDRLMGFAESASDWFWESDGNHCLTFISEAFELITGHKREKWIGQTHHALALTAVLNQETWNAHQNDLDNHRPFRNLSFACRRGDGKEAWISVSGRPIFDDSDAFTGYRGTCKDITEQIALEKALRGALAEAKAANAAKSEFLSSMSHELRTPLNGVLGFGQLLRMDEEDPLSPLQMEAVDQILNCGNHLLTLIEDVLDLSRIDQRQLVMEIADVSASNIVEESLAIIRNQLRSSGLELNVTGLYDGADPTVRADVGRAKQILLNLLTNAIKYNVTGTSIKLACSIQNGVYLRIAVSDDGPGIPEEKQKSLFQPFNRLGMEDQNIEGTGIGLTISKELIELMGGKIGFESVESKGSRFWVDLPLATSSQAAASAQSIPEILQARPTVVPRLLRKILYIEDNPANMMLMTMVVRRLDNVELIPAETAEIGIGIAVRELPHLILMDINLPGMNGIEALRELRSLPELRRTPIIAVSAAAMPSDVEAGAQAGFNRYITKPIQIGPALEIIQRTLDQVAPAT